MDKGARLAPGGVRVPKAFKGRCRFCRRIITCALLLALVLVLGGCSGDEVRNSPSKQQGVSDVIKEQADKASSSSSLEASGSEVGSPESTGPFVGDAKSAYDAIDYDLSQMSSDMVYATVYDMMVNPAAYEGKIVRMPGIYYSSYLEKTGTRYFHVIVQDATACCSQGIEFVWGDGSHVYPQEYPEEGASVIVTGRFEPYTEGSVNYEHLVDASLEAA